MWLSKKIKSSGDDSRAERGSITLTGNSLEAESSVNVRSIFTYSPYGYSYVPPLGDEVMLLPCADGRAMIGSRLKPARLKSGEIQISSMGGAKIILRNDGAVEINGLVINKEGAIENG